MTHEEATSALGAAVSSLSDAKKALFQQWLDAAAASDPEADDGITVGLIQCLLLGTMRVADIETVTEGPRLSLTDKGQQRAANALHTNPEARDLWNRMCASSGKGSAISEPPKRKQ